MVESIDEEPLNPSDLRLFAIANALHERYTIDQIWEFTKIVKWFLNKLKNIVELEKILKNFYPNDITRDILLVAKQLGFSDRQIT